MKFLVSSKKGNFVERMVPSESRSELYMAHLSRYNFVSKLLVCLNKHNDGRVGKLRVLDAGCGAGYGVFSLSKNADFSIGIDRCLDALNYAQRYRRQGCVFTNMDVRKMGFKN